MLISGIALVKEHLILFTQTFGIAIVVLITMYTDAILRMKRTVFLLSFFVYAACLAERQQIPIV
jgi:hypothetical protein